MGCLSSIFELPPFPARPLQCFLFLPELSGELFQTGDDVGRVQQIPYGYPVKKITSEGFCNVNPPF